MGWGVDSNVREAIDVERLSGGFLRLLVDASSGPIRKGNYAGAGGLRALADRYSRYGTESRDQIEGSLDLQRRVARLGAIWGNARMEFRSYPDSTRRNYSRSAIGFGIRAPFRGGILTLGGTGRGTDFRNTARFDRRGRAFSIGYRRPFSRRLELTGGLEFESIRWGRVAYDTIGPKGIDQRDQSRDASIGARYLRGCLFEGTVGWKSVRSNSLGYSLGRKSAEVGVSGWLPGAVLVQVRGRVESVSYRDRNLGRIFFVPRNENIDASEDNNTVMVRIRRRLMREIAIDGRASWFRNESPFVGVYYRKAVASLGLAWTPIGASEF